MISGTEEDFNFWPEKVSFGLSHQRQTVSSAGFAKVLLKNGIDGWGWDYSLRGLNPRVVEADSRLLVNANTPAELSAIEQDLAAFDQ